MKQTITIDDILLESLIEQAKNSERKRVCLDLRDSDDEPSQRLLNALYPGTVVATHRHRNSSETVAILKGRITEILFDDNLIERERYELCAEGGIHGIQIPQGVWHTVIVNEPCVIMESKTGKYEPLSLEDIAQKFEM